MPLHMTGMASRRSLEFGDEEPVKIAAPPLEKVLKYNPNHDPQTGRFTEGPGMRRGGTAGAPTEDAFGRPLGGRGLHGKPGSYRRSKAFGLSDKTLGESKGSWMVSQGSGFTTRGSLQRVGIDDGMIRGEPPKTDPNFHKGSNAPAFDPHFNRDTGTISGYGGSTGPYKKAFRGVKDTHTGSIKDGKPTQRSSFS